MSERRTTSCPYHETGIVTTARRGEINAGYTEADSEVIKRYRDVTGCLRHELAKSPEDTCQVTGFHAMQRKYMIRDRINLPGLKSAHLYEEVYEHLGRQAEATDRRLRGWRTIAPAERDISPLAINVDFLLDYEPDRDGSGTNAPTGGGFNLATMFDLRHPSTGRIHPAKLVLDYNPNTVAYTGLTFTVFNPSVNSRFSHFYDKMDILDMNGGTTNRLAQRDREGDTRMRLILGGADLGSDVDFEPNTGFRDCQLIYFHGNDSATTKRGGIQKEIVAGRRSYVKQRPRKWKLKGRNDIFRTHYQPELFRARGVPYWGAKTEAIINARENEFGMKHADLESGDISWSLPIDLLDTIPLPEQDFRYSGSYDQVRKLFPQLAQTFSELVYDRLKITDGSISIT